MAILQCVRFTLKGANMENNRTRYLMPDHSGRGNHLGIEVNWNSGVKPAKLLRFFDSKGNEYVIDRKELLSIMFMFGDESDQMDMITPVVQRQHMREYHFKFKARQDYHKGEAVVVSALIPIKTEVVRPRVMHSKAGLHQIL